MKPRMKLVVIALLGLWVLLFAGCNQGAPPPGGGGGGGGGGNATAQDVGKVLTAANAQLYWIESPLDSAGVPVPILGIAPFSAGLAPQDVAGWNCTGVTVTDDARDADGDGIPVNATYNGRCTWSYSGSGGSVSGYWEYKNVNVQDPDDHDSKAGVMVHGAIEWGVSSSNRSYTSTWTITQHDLVRSGNTYNFTYKGNWTLTVSSSSTFTFNYQLSGTWTPEDPNHPWYAGTMNATGSFSGTGPGCNGWSLGVKLSGVHDNGTTIDGGTAEFSGKGCDGSNCTVTVTWHSSGSPTVTGHCQ